MAVLEILLWPDERLRRPSLAVEAFDAEFQAFVADLEETRRAGPAAVGIAAPQVGRHQQVVIVDCSQTRRPVPNHGWLVLVNPQILSWEGHAMGREGCLSVPDYTGNVLRAERITLRAHDPDGQMHEYDMEGFEARAVQHELDHLDGRVFLDRVVSRHTDVFRRKQYT
ncbi:peptide deformylase [Acidihalobacter ferrooxydans]|uniref:Peptide deformylase n=1 Tax=Acidihalobacter ferrooxydans TaxID=1765967 RepID=A0A1P8UGC9_9GAMM|nr:peptide deformylase [Acidihalobacter ferrooxydans]APZ42903.1 peptide deformylase [Acidihalobacter ferrooxydans]